MIDTTSPDSPQGDHPVPVNPNPQTVADLASNLTIAASTVDADNQAIATLNATYATSLAAAQQTLTVDTATLGAANQAISAEVVNGGPFGVVSSDGTTVTVYEPNSSSPTGFTPRVARLGGAALTPAPAPAPTPAPTPAS